MLGDLRPSSWSRPGLLSLLEKCLCSSRSSSAVGWYGNWCSFSCDEHCDYGEKRTKVKVSSKCIKMKLQLDLMSFGRHVSISGTERSPTTCFTMYSYTEGSEQHL